VLVVPYAGTFASLGERVLIAWKDTREAARALRDALPLLRDARHVSLVEVGPVRTDAAGDGSLEAASAWLDSHSIPFAAHREIGLAEVGEQLLSRASDLGVDLIVCGGYGHSRLREWVLGGVTRHLLGHMTVPTLLSH
jgi:nucleotide-binding universal stress UspA family protein